MAFSSSRKGLQMNKEYNTMPEQNFTDDSLRQLAEEKEREWRELQQLRTESLEVALRNKEKELNEEKTKFNRLKEDFKYNLRLLNEHQAELASFDKLTSDLRVAVTKRDADVSNLKIKLDEVETSRAREAGSRQEMTGHYQQRIREKQAELDKYKAVKDGEIQDERQRLEEYKRTLERRVHELQEELELQKHELTAGFEEALRKREHEFRLQADEMSTTVLAHELKAKLLAKELEMAKVAAERSTAEVDVADSHQRQLEKAVKKAQWQLHDVTAIKDAKISELKGQLEHMEKSMKKMQEDYARKKRDVDKYMCEKEHSLVKLKEASQEEAEKLNEIIRDLAAKLEDSHIKVRQLEWNMADMEKDKDSMIERLQSEANDLQMKYRAEVQEYSRQETEKDFELERLHLAEGKLKVEIAQRKEDVERYKKDLSIALERQADLERAKAQTELDWQRRNEEVERQQYERSEDLVKRLTQARDEMRAELTSTCRELEQREEVIKVLMTEKDRAYSSLRQHGIPLQQNVTEIFTKDLPDSTADHMTELHTQNENLRAVIRQMRKEMENLGSEMPVQDQTPPAEKVPVEGNLIANEYVKNLEKEVQQLKSQIRKIEHDFKHTEGKKSEEANDKMTIPPVTENMVVKSHMEMLNNTIGTLRTEKMQLVAQLRKQQTRIDHLETGLAEISREPVQKQATIEQLQYEVSSQQRRHLVEVAALKGRVADLELQLAETRKETDEYYKANIERNMEVTALQNELSTLKMDLAQKRPAVNFGAQELVIQQLQDEIGRLRSKDEPAFDDLSGVQTGGEPPRWAEKTSVRELHAKLRQAARHISQLAREKKQLIEMGNRLRAQLHKAGISTSGPVRDQPAVGAIRYVPPQAHGSSQQYGSNQGHLFQTTSTSLSEKMQNKLNQLEKLQYELTKQELSRAQQDQPGLSTGDTLADVSLSSGSVSLGPLGSADDEGLQTIQDDYRPPSILKKSNRDAPVKLSPVPEDIVSQARPQSTLGDTVPRPDSALSDSFRPTTGQSERDRGQILSMSSMGMSSVGGQSLAEIWRMLDEDGVSPRPFTPLHSGDGPFRGLQYPGDAYCRSGSSDILQVKGIQPQLEPRPKPKQSPAVKQSAKRGGKKFTKKTVVRNYNVQDDASIQ